MSGHISSQLLLHKSRGLTCYTDKSDFTVNSILVFPVGNRGQCRLIKSVPPVDLGVIFNMFL